MQTEPNAKQQIVEKIKNSTNILVTVGSNPSVDALSAALGLTLMLNRLDKHATAVFSGQVPPAITFLEPDKTFENTVDSLRDFIIALDKEKADRLRYKVEDEVVRIFITPYKTVLSENDLKFSQGDFNVELIIALGVEQREDLDTAITAHGRILHDATVMTINADNGPSTLGSVDWSEASASSLCEMLMSLSEALQSGLLDQQIATALLTGIVAATDRFRNEHTSPKVMTMAAQLMAAGANQQLIAAKLEEGHALPEPSAESTSPTADGTVSLTEGRSEKVVKKDKKASKKDGALEITHAPKPDAAALPDPGAEALKEAENELAKSLEQSAVPVTPTVSLDDIQKDLEAAASDVSAAASTVETSPDSTETPKIIKQEHRNWRSEPGAEPTFGGTLNATVSDAEAAAREEEKAATNHMLLSHDTPKVTSDIAEQPEGAEPSVPELEPPVIEPAPKPIESTDDDALSFEATPVAPSPSGPSLAEIDSQTRGKDAEDARAAIDAALSAMPFNAASKPLESAGAVPALELNHDEPTPNLAPAPVPDVMPVDPLQPEVPAVMPPSVLPMPPPLPPLPDFSDPSVLADAPGITPSSPVPPVQAPPASLTQETADPQTPPADPGQFKIPGQQ